MTEYIAGDSQWRYPGYGDDLPPTGAKCLILTQGGICVVGAWGHGCIAWAPLPKRDKARELHEEVRNALDSADIKQRMGQWPREL